MHSKLYTFFNSTSKWRKPNLQRASALVTVALAVCCALPSLAQTPPPAPTVVTATPSAVCQGSSTNLKATSIGNTIRWYTVANGGVAIGISNSGAIFSVSPSFATTYYAESLSPDNIASNSRGSVTVAVNTVPVLTFVPPDVSTTNASGACGAVVFYPAALATGQPTPTILYSKPSGQNFNVGTTTVLTTAANVCGNTSLSFDVSVVDQESPIELSLPDTNITAPVGASSMSNVDLGSPKATDNCGVITISNNAPGTFHAGTTDVTWTVTDEDGHSISAVQHVTIVVQGPSGPPAMGAISTSDPDNLASQYSSINLNLNWDAQSSIGAPYSVNVDWRDSSAHSVLNNVTSNSASLAHTYNKTGVFAPIVIVKNSGNYSDTTLFKYIVVYGGANYSTTADGNFTLPMGATFNVPGVSLNNRNVAFGDQCKPKTGCPGVFDGDLRLEMGGNHFTFETETLSWEYLAISSCYIAQFEGSGYMYPNGHKKNCHGGCHGACNPTSIHYGILVVQTDKQASSTNGNKLRVKIWNKDNGDVILDTQPNAADNAMPTTSYNGCIKVKVPSNCVARADGAFAEVTAGTFEATVSPNPFASAYTVDVKTASNSNVSVDVYDIFGRRMQHLTDLLPNQPLTINNDLPDGAYVLHITQDDRTQVVKLLKNK